METPTTNKKTPAGMIAAALLVVALIAVVAYSTTRSNPAIPTPQGDSTTMENTFPADVASPYKNGTYTVDGNYISPGGAEKIGVTLTLDNGIITDAAVETGSERPMSEKFQGIFAENYKDMVVGKNIDEVVLDKVAGSSLTPKGFNDAVEKIKAEAQA